jgi:uncharacterized FlaG/YvyC family protein
MEISAVNRGAEAVAMAAATIPVEQNSDQRELIQAVRAVNSSEMFGQDNELAFHRDQDTRKMVIQVTNRKTGDVISQIPPEYVLAMAREMKEAMRG